LTGSRLLGSGRIRILPDSNIFVSGRIRILPDPEKTPDIRPDPDPVHLYTEFPLLVGDRKGIQPVKSSASKPSNPLWIVVIQQIQYLRQDNAH